MTTEDILKEALWDPTQMLLQRIKKNEEEEAEEERAESGKSNSVCVPRMLPQTAPLIVS